MRTRSGTRTGGQRARLVVGHATAAALAAPLSALLAAPLALAEAPSLAAPLAPSQLVALAGPPAAHAEAKHPHHGLRVLHPGQYAQLAGTDIYVVVTDTHQGVALWGQIVPPGSRSGAGYFFVAQESRVAVGKWAVGGGGGVFIFQRQQPAGTPPSTRAHRATGGFTINLGQEMRVDGTSLVLKAARDPEGNPYLASLLMPGRAPLEASYELTISQGEVAALRWEEGKPVPVFVRSEPAFLRTPPTSGTTTTTTTAPRHRGAGRSYTLDQVEVQLLSVQDNAAPEGPPGTPPAPGETFDAVTLEVTNLGSRPYQASSNASTEVVGTDGKAYYPDASQALAGCTGFGGPATTGTINLPPGASETGCVNFALPDGVAIKLVEFSPEANWTPGNYIYWELSPKTSS